MATNIWLFGPQRTALTRAAHQLPFHPNLFLLVTLLVIFSGFFHELGHATATRYGGGSPGVMGVGIYLAWPAFYTDLTDSYRLNRAGRLRSDLGGVYFNAVLIVAAGAAYLLTGFGPLAVFIVISQAMAMYQFLPFIRLDGYYIMSDLVGVPNLFAYLGPVLRSIFRRSDAATNARLNLLKPRARLAIKIWSIVTILFLTFNFVGIAVLAPIILPAEWASIHLQGQAMAMAFARGDVAVGLNDLVDLVITAIAPVGLLLIAGILLRRAFRALKKWWPAHPGVTAVLAALLAGVLLFQGQGLVSRLEASPGSSGSTAVTSAGSRPGPAPLTPSSPTLSPGDAHLVPAHPAPAGPVVAAYTAPARFCVVEVGDTLWGIAAQDLGDPERWPAIFDLNVGRPQPDGRTLVDPDLIYPGWRLELPGPQPVASPVPQAGTPVVRTDDAVVARPSSPPPDQAELATGPSSPGTSSPSPSSTPGPSPGTSSPSPSPAVPAPTSASPPPTVPPTAPAGVATSKPVSPPTRAAGGQAPPSVAGTRPGDPSSTTTTSSTTATGGCARRTQGCQQVGGGSGPPGPPPPGPGAQRAPPRDEPLPSPRGSPTTHPVATRPRPPPPRGT